MNQRPDPRGKRFSPPLPLHLLWIWMGLLVFPGCGPTSTGGITEDFDGDGYTLNQADCDDRDHYSYPNAPEIPYDGIDQDCNGSDLVDVDGDGYIDEGAGGDDCDASDPNTNPGATDTANGNDDDCDGGVDGPPGGTVGIVDRDRDGYAATASGGNDCNDLDPSIHPGAVDIGNDGVDQDCDGSDPTSTTGVDQDGDGYTSEGSGGDDPDDSDPDSHPGAYDPPGDGIDQDGSGEDGPGVIKVDRDDDGYDSQGTGGTDCNDADDTIHPGATDFPDNGLDEDCSGADSGTAAPVDNDTDGHVSLATGGDDCDDRDPNVYPGAVDPSGDSIDQDCNGVDGTGAAQTGDGSPPVDADRDGYAASYAGGNDCNDSDPSIHPGAVDVGNDGVDSDCDGSDPSSTTGVDADGDGYTSQGSGGDDPDDNDSTVHPGAPDPVGDGIDQDGSCSDFTNPPPDCGDGPGTIPYDHDGDGWASTGTGGLDCDDFNASISPSANEVNGNGIDENCDGLDGSQPVPVDLDFDGFYAEYTGGNDCNDLDPSIHPGANEIDGDCIDSDCSGSDDVAPASPNGQDLDNDGFYTCASGGNDCDDSRADVHVGATDFPYNGVDEDCNGSDLVDYDRDGFAAVEVSYGTDCNDSQAGVNPEADEIPYNGLDEDCSGADLTDVDKDGYASKAVTGGTDCDDARSGINPGAADIPYNGVDEDCIGGDYDDLDADGFASNSVTGGTDCNDNNATVHPGSTELADGQDNDCDNKVDETTSLYDDDADGFSEVQGDCNDANANVKPGATETRDGLDNDCNGRIDDLDPVDYYSTADGWNFYQSGDYSNAKLAFTDALLGNPFDADAFNGLAWTSYRLKLLTDAQYYFDTALALEPDLPEALAGSAAAALLVGRPDLSIGPSERVLGLKPYPTFRYGLASIDTVLLSLGNALVQTGDLISARTVLDELAPGHGLTPYVSSSWKVDGKSYSSYRVAVLMKLKSIQAGLE